MCMLLIIKFQNIGGKAERIKQKNRQIHGRDMETWTTLIGMYRDHTQ